MTPATNKYNIATRTAIENPDISQAGLAKLLTAIDPVNFPNLEQARGIARKIVGPNSRPLYDKSLASKIVDDTADSPQPEKAPVNCLSEAELRQKYDVFYIVKQAAEKLKTGVFVPESEFARQAGLRGQQGSRLALDNAELGKYHGKAGGTVYWSHPESIAKMKKETILS